jgi:hypothetical protein
MASGDSQISVINIGLSAIGEDPITDINAPYKRAIGMKGAFDRVRRQALEMHPWRFAKTLAQLSASATPPPFGYGNAFDLPADHVRPFDDVDDSRQDWEIVGNQLMTDAGGPLNYVYVRDHRDVTQWPPLFCTLLGQMLGADQCEYITQSAEKQTKVDSKVSETLALARNSSAQASNPREFDDDILLRSRA